MKTIESRILSRACDYIDLSDAEKKHYGGCGEVLFAAEEGEITAIEYLGNLESSYGATPKKLVEDLLDWAGEQTGEIWFGMASGYQISDPRKIDTGDAKDLAFLARVAGDIYRDD